MKTSNKEVSLEMSTNLLNYSLDLMYFWLDSCTVNSIVFLKSVIMKLIGNCHQFVELFIRVDVILIRFVICLIRNNISEINLGIGFSLLNYSSDLMYFWLDSLFFFIKNNISEVDVGTSFNFLNYSSDLMQC